MIFKYSLILTFLIFNSCNWGIEKSDNFDSSCYCNKSIEPEFKMSFLSLDSTKLRFHLGDRLDEILKNYREDSLSLNIDKYLGTNCSFEHKELLIEMEDELDTVLIKQYFHFCDEKLRGYEVQAFLDSDHRKVISYCNNLSFVKNIGINVNTVYLEYEIEDKILMDFELKKTKLIPPSAKDSIYIIAFHIKN